MDSSIMLVYPQKEKSIHIIKKKKSILDKHKNLPLLAFYNDNTIKISCQGKYGIFKNA